MTEKFLIKNGILQNPGEPEQKADILVQDGKVVDIRRVGIPDCKNIKIIDAEGHFVTPGLIDQHLHGGYDCNFNTAETEDILNLLSNLPKHGVTSICPTIMTDTPENIKTQIEKIKEAKEKTPQGAAKIVGINLEGPFINPEFRGAHPESLCLKPTIENYKLFEDDLTKIITIAPELDEDFKLTKYLVGKGVIVSAGHSNADRETFLKAVNSGLTLVTHIFNAMSPLHHRNPSLTGNALVNDKVYTEVIADHNHLHPDIVQLIFRSKPQDKVILISDSLPLNQSSQESTVFGGQKIFKQGEIAVNEEGNFAGSLMFLDSVIKKNRSPEEQSDEGSPHPKAFDHPERSRVPTFSIEYRKRRGQSPPLKTSFSDLLTYCTLNPAQNLNLQNTGYIAKGMTADLVLWDTQTLEVKSAFVNGHQAF